MVLKKSKFGGGNTGNTLRRCKGYNANRTAAFISKQVPDRSKSLDDWTVNGIECKKNDNSLNTSDSTKFSLNKDKRWLLPEQLKDEIVRKCQEEKLWKRSLRQASSSARKKCDQEFLEYARVAVIEKILDQKDGNINCYMNSVYDKYNKKSRSCTGPLDVPSKIKETMDVTYTIENVADNKSWLQNVDRPNDLHHKTHKKCTKKFEDFNDDFYDDSSDEYDAYDDWEEEEDDETLDVNVRTYLCTTMPLEMFIRPNIKKKKRCNRVADDGSEIGSENYIIIEKPEEFFEITDAFDVDEEEFEITNAFDVQDFDEKSNSSPTDGYEITNELDITSDEIFEKEFDDEDGIDVYIESGTHLDSRNLAPNNFKEFECKLKDEEISPEYLIKRFGEKYVEGQCTPRRFMIFNDDFHVDGVIMFVKILTTKNTLSTAKITAMNVSEKLVSFLGEHFSEDTISFPLLVDSCFSRNDDVAKASKPAKNALHEKTIIDKEFKPNGDLVGINDICRQLFAERLHGADGETFHANYYEAICPICYSIEELTCMNDCPHYVCDRCWRSYISKKVSSGHYSTISCPDTNCKQTVDLVTVLSYADYKLVSRVIRKLCEQRIRESPHLKLCPSPDCDTVAVCRIENCEEVKNKAAVEKFRDNSIANNPCVDCHCKLVWCFNCREPDHWPSSCIANKKYQLQKKKEYSMLFDISGNIIEINIHYKACPKCNYPIQKDGGTRIMRCRFCQHAFCWNCLSDLPSHPVSCATHAKEESVTLNSLDVFGDNYKNCSQRDAFEFSSMRTKVKALKRKLKLGKIRGKIPDLEFKSSAATASRAVMLLTSGFKLLENLSVANAACQSKSARGRIVRFVKTFTFVLGLLRDSIDVNGLDKMNAIEVRKNIEFVHSSLGDLSSIGLERK